MSVKIRLTRVGRHKDPFFRIVVADSRYARDGRYIEQLGFFDPAKGLDSAVIDEELTLKWLSKGAAPSETIRTLFTKKGLMVKLAESKKNVKGDK
ncbi:MAG: 30S ribosomal protein S16 [Bacilli bacterium]|jgi:small subunit ribosomal protein S16